MTYTQSVPLPREELAAILGLIVKSEIFNEFEYVEDFVEDSIVDFFDKEMQACQRLADKLISTHGAGMLRVETFRDERSSSNVVRVWLTVFSKR